MQAAPTSAQEDTAGPDIVANAQSFGRHLRAGNKAPATIHSYLDAVARFDAFLEGSRNAARRDVSPSRARRGVRRRPALPGSSPPSAANRYRSLQQFFPWLVDEGEIHESPMGKMHPTTIPETPPPVLLENQIRKLLDATSGQDFDDRRDTAIDLLLGRGCPRAESIHRLHSHGSRPAESRGSVRPLRSGRRQYALRYEERTRRQSPRPSESHRKPAHAAAGLQAFALLA